MGLRGADAEEDDEEDDEEYDEEDEEDDLDDEDDDDDVFTILATDDEDDTARKGVQVTGAVVDIIIASPVSPPSSIYPTEALYQ